MKRSEATIRWIPPNGLQRECTFSDTCAVGRAHTNRIILDGEDVSRQQALFTLTTDRLVVRNLSTTRVIRLNADQALAPGEEAALEAGDAIHIGAHSLRIDRVSLVQPMVRCRNAVCQKEVPAHLSDCPWCGRSLAFAQTRFGER